MRKMRMLEHSDRVDCAEGVCVYACVCMHVCLCACMWECVCVQACMHA